jgi:predicted RNase H-like nuclease (RuvC/YqgF family)
LISETFVDGFLYFIIYCVNLTVKQERVRERGRTHIRIAREAQDLKRYVEEQKETIVQLKKDINRLKKKCGKQNRPSSQNYRVG